MDLRLLDSQGISALTPADLDLLVHQIGHTPLQLIYLMINGIARTVYLKLEGANPTGSIKDRTGYALVQNLEEQGMLSSNTIAVESTSGNLGVALALICKARGYTFIAVIDPKTTSENRAKMQALGARIELVEQPDTNGGYLLSRLERVQQLCRQSQSIVWTNQYSNPVNPLIHYRSTGPEIYHQMEREVDAIFVPVSTGGTLAGISSYFREVSPRTHIIAVDAQGSVIFGAPPAPRKLTGIGSSQASHFITSCVYDQSILIGDAEAFTFCRTLDVYTGLKVGGSSGAVLAACARYLQIHPHLRNVVCVCSDSGENYGTSIFNDTWLKQHGFSPPLQLPMPVQD